MLTALRVAPGPVALGRVLLAAGAALTSFEGAVILVALRGDHVTAPVATWLPDAAAMPVLPWVAIMAIASVTLLLGLFPGPSAAALAAGNALLLAVDHQLYSNHRFLVVLLCAWYACARSDHAYAIGAGARRRAGDGLVPWWPQLLVLATVSSCYVYAGLSKANEEFLTGDLVASMSPDWVPAALVAWATVPAEIAIGVGLWWRRTRLGAIALGLALHAGIVALLGSPLVFSAFALLCFSAYPLALHRVELEDLQAEAAATQRSSAD